MLESLFKFIASVGALSANLVLLILVGVPLLIGFFLIAVFH